MSTKTGESPADAQSQAQDALLKGRMGRIKQKIVVLSGKGGVGKSTVSANLAVALSQAGNTVGIMDVDVHGPSIHRLLHLTDKTTEMDEGAMLPVSWSDTLKVMSLGFLLHDKYAATIWRGPVKAGVIRQFLQDVDWGDLDYLVVDCPPGTGDEPLSVLQLLGTDAAAVIVTSPQIVAIDDVRRSVGFCHTLGNPILGLVENMSGFTCPTCSTVSNVFGSGGGETLAEETSIPFLGRIPLAQEIMAGGEAGSTIADLPRGHPVGQAFTHIVEKIRHYSAGLALQNSKP